MDTTTVSQIVNHNKHSKFKQRGRCQSNSLKFRERINEPGPSPVGATLNDGPVSFFTLETTALDSTNFNLSIAHRPELEVKIYSISVIVPFAKRRS